jgi:hypothetical protein
MYVQETDCESVGWSYLAHNWLTNTVTNIRVLQYVRNWQFLKKYCAPWSTLFAKLVRTSLDLTVEPMVSKTINVSTNMIFSLSPCIDHVFVTVHNVTKFRVGWSPSHPHSHKSLFFCSHFLNGKILDEIRKRKANWIGHILRRNCLLKQVIEGKIKGEIEMTRRRGRRRKKLLDDLKDRTRQDTLIWRRKL